MSLLNDVRDFHLAFAQSVAAAPGLPDIDTRRLRIRLLAEEIAEYHQAEAQDDLIETARELADIVYIICGTAVAYGLNTGRDTPAGITRFAGPDRPAFARPSLRQARRDDIAQQFAAYEAAESHDDLGAISAALTALLESVFTCALMYSIPLLEVFQEVHQANMRKLVEGKVLRREDGKIIKPPGWVPPNIQAVLFAC